MARETKLTIGGKELTLRFTFGRLAAVKKETGVDLLKPGSSERIAEVDVLPGLIYALAGGAKSGMSVDAIGEALDPYELEPVIEKLVELFQPDPT